MESRFWPGDTVPDKYTQSGPFVTLIASRVSETLFEQLNALIAHAGYLARGRSNRGYPYYGGAEAE